MHIDQVEIYSDATNRAILRHPDRRFPGVLVQGDTLWALCRKADLACVNGRSEVDAIRYETVNDLRNALWSLLTHYKAVLADHEMQLPFSEISPTGAGA